MCVHQVHGAEPRGHTRSDVTVETRAFRPTPFQVTELSLQQEEAFPGLGLPSGVPGPGILFLVRQGHPVVAPGGAGALRGAGLPEPSIPATETKMLRSAGGSGGSLGH